MRRNVIHLALCAMLFALCSFAQAQQPAKVPRIGFQLDSPASAVTARTEAFRQGLRELGYIEGKNIIIEWRSAEGKIERRSELAIHDGFALRADEMQIVSQSLDMSRFIDMRRNRASSHCGQSADRATARAPAGLQNRASRKHDRPLSIFLVRPFAGRAS